MSIKHLRSIVIAAAVLSLAGCQPRSPVTEPEYWPTDGWRSKTPEELGIDSDKLAEMLTTIRELNVNIHSLLVIRHGYVALDATFYPYDGKSPHNIASVTKSLMTTLIGIAVDQGKLDLDDRMVSFFPERTIIDLDEGKTEITIRHLASMTSGLDCTSEHDEQTLKEMVASLDYVQFVLDRKVTWVPGTHFVYCSPAIHILSPILQKATRMTTLDFARQFVFEPLGFGDVMWPEDPQGYNDGWADVSLDTHDMAKLGFLFLHQGEWDGDPIVSRQWVEAATQAQIRPPNEDPYGYGWWIEMGPKGASARGRGGQGIYVLPEWDMVIATTGGGFEMDEIAEMLVASFVDFENPLPANPAGVARLEATVEAMTRAPEPSPVAPLPDVAMDVSGKTYVFDRNPVHLQDITLAFDGTSEATVVINGLEPALVGLEGVFLFSPGADGRPVAFRGSWVDEQTFLLEYDGIINNDHAFLRLRFEGDTVEVKVQETAHEASEPFVGVMQQP